MADTQATPEEEEGTSEKSSRPEEVRGEGLDQQRDLCRPLTANIWGSESDSPRPPMVEVPAESDLSLRHNLKTREKPDTLDTQELQKQSGLDQQHTSVKEKPSDAHGPEEDADNYHQIKNMKVLLDRFGTSLDQGGKKASHVQLYLRAQARAHLDELQNILPLLTTETEIHCVNINMDLEKDNKRLEQENRKLSGALSDSQSMCDRLQQKIRDLELEKTNYSAENNVVTSLQEYLQKEKEHLTNVYKKLPELMHDLDCKEAQLVAQYEKAFQEILVRQGQVNEAQEDKRKIEKSQLLLSSNEKEMVRGKNMNLYLKGQNSLLEQRLEKVSNEKLDLQAQVQEAQASAAKLQKTQSLLSSMEAEVQQVREVNMELERRNNLLEQENVKISTELHQVKTKESSAEELLQYLLHECECLQKKLVKLELEQADYSTDSSSIITRLEEDLKTERAQLAAVNKKVSDLMQEFHLEGTELVEKLGEFFKEKQDLQAQVHEDQTVRELQETQNQLPSIEAEVQRVKNLNLELERQNNLLKQENLKISTELHQVKTKESSAEERLQHLLHECECLQKKLVKLELEQADYSTDSSSIITRLEEDLKTERAQLAAVNKKVSDLMEEFHLEGTELVEKLGTLDLQAQVHEGQTSELLEMNLELERRNNLLEQENVKLSEELHQVKITEDATEESVLLQQLNNRLITKEVECKKTKEDLANIQKANNKLKEDLCCSLFESQRLNQKYNEDRIKLETMLCQAEQMFNKETTRLKSTIRKLETEVNKLNLVIFEEKDWIFEEGEAFAEL